MTEQHFELSALAKPYFVPEDLLVLTVDDSIQGFLHISPAAIPNSEDADSTRSTLSALCVVPCDYEAEIAAQLLTRTDELNLARGTRTCWVRPMLPDCPFYLGFGAGDSMMGITTVDQRTYGWLASADYVPQIATSGWELQLDRFQAPVDRMQIQIRRAAHVDRLLDEPLLPWRQACMLGHTEPIGFQLTMRSDGVVVQQLLLWTVGQELLTQHESIVWLWPFEVGNSPQATDQMLFLLAESLRQMAEDRVDLVRTFSEARNTQVATILTRLGFRVSLSGVVMEKRYATTTLPALQ